MGKRKRCISLHLKVEYKFGISFRKISTRLPLVESILEIRFFKFSSKLCLKKNRDLRFLKHLFSYKNNYFNEQNKPLE